MIRQVVSRPTSATRTCLSSQACMYSLLIALVIAALLSDAVEARAAESVFTSQYEACKKHLSDNAGWSGCGQEEIRRQEQLLTKAWNQAAADMAKYASWNKDSGCEGCGQQAQSLLNTDQENWRKWEKSACEYIRSGIYGKEAESLAYPECKAATIAERIATLRHISQAIDDAMSH